MTWGGLVCVDTFMFCVMRRKIRCQEPFFGDLLRNQLCLRRIIASWTESAFSCVTVLIVCTGGWEPAFAFGPRVGIVVRVS